MNEVVEDLDVGGFVEEEEDSVHTIFLFSFFLSPVSLYMLIPDNTSAFCEYVRYFEYLKFINHLGPFIRCRMLCIIEGTTF